MSKHNRPAIDRRLCVDTPWQKSKNNRAVSSYTKISNEKGRPNIQSFWKTMEKGSEILILANEQENTGRPLICMPSRKFQTRQKSNYDEYQLLRWVDDSCNFMIFIDEWWPSNNGISNLILDRSVILLLYEGSIILLPVKWGYKKNFLKKFLTLPSRWYKFITT